MKAFFWKNLYDEFGDLKIGDQKHSSSFTDMNIVHKLFFGMHLRSTVIWVWMWYQRI